MSKRQVIMLISLVVAIIQFLGFPTAWDKLFTFVGGMLILVIAYRMAPRVKAVDVRSLPYMEYKKEEIGTITNPDIDKTQ